MRRFLSLLASKQQHSIAAYTTKSTLSSTLTNQQFNLPSGLPISSQLNKTNFSSSSVNYLFGKTPGRKSLGSAFGRGNNDNNNNNNKKQQQDKGASTSNLSRKKTTNNNLSRSTDPDFNARKPTRSRNNSTGKSNRRRESNNKEMSRSSKPHSSDCTSFSSSSVTHDKAKHQFTLNLGDHKEARIEYKPLYGGAKNKIEMYHTEVPVELRNQGIGKTLARGALERAREEKLKVRLTCSYLINYLDKFGGQAERSIVEE